MSDLLAEYESWVVSSRYLTALAAALEAHDLQLHALVPRSASAAAAAVGQAEQEFGVLVVDIGAQQTDAIVYSQGQIADLFSIPLGVMVVIGS